MKEIRIDCAHQSEAELAFGKKNRHNWYSRLNHTMPMTDEYDGLLHRLFSKYGGRQSCEYPAYCHSSP